MQYAIIENEIVKKILASTEPIDGGTPIPSGHQLRKGDDTRFFDANYRRKSAEDCVSEGLLTVGENETALWEQGKYVVKPDYRGTVYWYKSTGQPVRFEVGDKPDETMTDVDPQDGDAVWDEGTGIWYVPEDVKAERVRSERTRLLTESDYIMMPDYPMTDKGDWADYRQTLRDIPEQAGFPDAVTWPLKPEVK